MDFKPGRILTVTPNPALDRTYSVPGFSLDSIHRTSAGSVRAGGKGINVARWAQLLEHDAVATGWIGGSSGEQLVRLINSEGIASSFINLVGETRTNLKIIDPDNGTQTEINEAGPEISAAALAEFYAHWSHWCLDFDIIVLAGSLAPGVPDTFYGDLVQRARTTGTARIMVDASGPSLKHAAEAGPWCIKPNVLEAVALGASSSDAGATAAQLRKAYEIPYVLVSDGARGAALAVEAGCWWVDAPRIELGSAVGSGDAAAAGLACATLGGQDAANTLRLAVACGSLNARKRTHCYPNRAEIIGFCETLEARQVA